MENAEENVEPRPCGTPKQYWPVIRRVVVPTDFSGESLAALGHAVYYGSAGAEIFLLHVAPNVNVPLAEYPSFYPMKDMSGTIREKVEAELGRIIAECAPAGVKMTPAFRTGAVAHEIIEFAKSEKADLIIMSTHGCSTGAALKRLLLSSNAEIVLRQAPCPVLAVRVEPGESSV
jgi:nucleotide-binding universal stress UspA family protein